MSSRKADLRAKRLAALKASPATAAQSEAIAARVVALPAFAAARCVALYAALPGEPDAARIWAAAADKRVVCPGAGTGGPELRAAPGLAAMARTARGFLEPPPGPSVNPTEVDVWVLPGLAFDGAGVRLGRGGGYYDRLLGARRLGSVAVGVIPELLRSRVPLPREQHDAAMDVVVTERASYFSD